MKTKITKRHHVKVNSEPSPPVPPPEDIIISLKKEIASLQKEKIKAEKKIQAQETTILTVKNQKAQAVHRFVILQAKYDELIFKQPKEVDPETLNTLKEFI